MLLDTAIRAANRCKGFVVTDHGRVVFTSTQGKAELLKASLAAQPRPANENGSHVGNSTPDNTLTPDKVFWR